MIRCACPRCVRADNREAWGAWQGVLFENLPTAKAPTRAKRLARLFELSGKALPAWFSRPA